MMVAGLSLFEASSCKVWPTAEQRRPQFLNDHDVGPGCAASTPQAGDQRGLVDSRGRDRRLRREPADDVLDESFAWVGKKGRTGTERQHEIGASPEQPGVRRQHADDHVAAVWLTKILRCGQVDRPANDLGIAAVAPLPEFLAEQHDTRAAKQMLHRTERPPDRNPDSEHTEKIRRNHRGQERLRRPTRLRCDVHVSAACPSGPDALHRRVLQLSGAALFDRTEWLAETPDSSPGYFHRLDRG
jgi:hypothetical protein